MMLRIILAAIVGFVIWSVLWLGSEKALSALSPGWLGANQAAFEAAVSKGGDYTPDTSILILNIVRGSIVSVVTGFIAALIAGENRRTPWILGTMLVAFGLLVVVMSWKYIPVWYHVVFTLLLVPMTWVGARLKGPTTVATHAK